MKLSEVVTVKQEQCPKCISYIYSLPHITDEDLAKELRVFGKESYPLDVIDLFKVEQLSFYAEFVLGSKSAKIWFEKTLGTHEIDRMHDMFKDALVNWISDKLDSDIERG